MSTIQKNNSKNCPSSCPCRAVGLRLSIWTAAQLNDISTVARLIEASADHAGKLDDYGFAPLHFAAQQNNRAIVDLLLSNGAHPDGCTSDNVHKSCGATPLHRAAFSGALQSCQRLITAGANIDAIDTSFGDGRSALHKAAAEGHVNIVNLLIDSGADVTVQDRAGKIYSELLPAAETAENNLVDPKDLHDTRVNSNPSTIGTIGAATLKTEDNMSASRLKTCSWCGQPDIAFSPYKDGVLCQKCTKNRARKVC